MTDDINTPETGNSAQHSSPLDDPQGAVEDISKPPPEDGWIPKLRKPDPFEAGSIGYRDAGAAMRQAFHRAARVHDPRRLNGTEWRVLAVIVGETVGYSKPRATLFTARIAELADLDRTTRERPTETRRALKRLAKLGIIDYQPSRRDGTRSIIGLPPAVQEPDERESTSPI